MSDAEVRGAEPLRVSLPVGPRPYALVDSVRLQRFGRPDPTVTIDTARGRERFAKCARTAAGPVTMAAWLERSAGGEARVEVALYGAGADFVAPRLPSLLGLDDEGAGALETASHLRLAPLRKAFAATRLVWALSLSELHAMIILQQRVTFEEAARSWRAAALAVGERAPGPLPLWLPPAREHWLGLGQPRARALGIDAQRWRHLVNAARAAPEIDASWGDRAALAATAARIGGTGPWTSGLLLGLGAADADAIVLGDLHLANEVSAFLTDVPYASDERMVELLEPFKPHRFRVVRVMLGSGRRRL